MTELAIRLLLPVAAGYLTFALIARQAMPWAKPTEAEHQPRWVLACWLGAAVALTSTLVIYMQLAGQISAYSLVHVQTKNEASDNRNGKRCRRTVGFRQIRDG